MEFRIEAPLSIEARSIDIQETAIVVSPVAVKGQHQLRVAYLTAAGAGGASTKAILLFNANTGEFNLQRLDAPDVEFAFDKPVTEFKATQQAARERAKAAFQKQQDKKSDKPVDESSVSK